MAQGTPSNEPAFAWAITFTLSSMTMAGLSLFMADSGPTPPNLILTLLTLTAGNFLVGAAVALAMGEPLPRITSSGKVPLRLRFAWAVLGFVPPPGRLLRLLLAGGLSFFFILALEQSEFSYIAAGLLMLSAFFLSKPKSILEMSIPEAFIFLSTVVMGAVALFMVATGAGSLPWQGAGILAAVLLFQGQRAREVTALRWAELLPGVAPPPALDLSRYELSVAHKAPEVRAALPAGVEAQLVDSGSFRVDAAKMLTKLRKYQLSDPRDFLSAWLRSAAASGATKISLSCVGGGLELRFDGRAFSTAELSQPYQVLVAGEGADAARGRHFAYGLLGLYRLKPRWIGVTSRGPDGVATMSVGAKNARQEDVDAAPEGTHIRVEWPFWASWWRPRLLVSRAHSRFGLGPAALSVNGFAVQDSPTDWFHFEKSGWRGAYRRRITGSRVRLHLLGAFVEELEDASKARVDAWLTHPELDLDISQSAVVRGELLQRGLGILDGEVSGPYTSFTSSWP